MLIEWLRRQEQLDLVLFADTGGEKPETYAFRDTFFAWLKQRTKALLLTVSRNSKDASLEAECLRTKSLPSKAYGRSRCSQTWKIQPQDIYVNNWLPAREAWNVGDRVVKLIGYDAGEPWRADNLRSVKDDKYTFRHPLIEWGWAREECAAAIVAAGLQVPPKSACFFCPSSRLSEILQLRDEHPELMERALAMEANAELDIVKGLGRRFSWRAVLEQDRRQLKLFEQMPYTPCSACYDGEED
jgi:hypothetical protein